MNVHVGERVGPFVVVANESTIPARKRRVVVRCVVCERVSEMNERSLLDKRTEEQRGCAKCRVYTTNGTWVKGWRAKMENAAAEANRLNEENARLRDEIDKVMRERDLALGRLENEIKAANQARMAEERAREALEAMDAAVDECLPGDDDDAPIDCVERAGDKLRELARERDEARAEVEKLSESAKAAWEAECVMREQRDRYHAEWKQERQEVERLRTALLEVQTSESAPAWFADGFHDGWKAGAEAMREACAKALMADGLVLSRERAANVVRALPIPEES